MGSLIGGGILNTRQKPLTWPKSVTDFIRRVCRYQRGNQNPYFEEEQTTQWQKKNYKMTNNDLQNIHIKIKDRVTRTPLKTGGDLRRSGRVRSFCSTSDTRRVNLVTNP